MQEKSVYKEMYYIMKMLMKRLSKAILFAALLVISLLLTVPALAENEGNGSYISALSGAAIVNDQSVRMWSYDEVNFQSNVDMLSDYGYSSLWFDFNMGAFMQSESQNRYWFAPIALGYQTTTNKDDAITDIIVVDDGSGEATKEINGIIYYVVGGWESYHDVSQVDAFDFNRFVGGQTIYLYYTKDTAAGEPLTALMGSTADYESGCNCVLDINGACADLNDGARTNVNSAVYLHCTREAANSASVFGGSNSAVILIIAAAAAIVAALIALKKLKQR